MVLVLPGLDEVQYFLSRKWFITDWSDYVAPVILQLSGVNRDVIMLVAGLAQLLVAALIVVRPRAAGILACCGFGAIIVNLLLHNAYDRHPGLRIAGRGASAGADEPY